MSFEGRVVGVIGMIPANEWLDRSPSPFFFFVSVCVPLSFIHSNSVKRQGLLESSKGKKKKLR